MRNSWARLIAGLSRIPAALRKSTNTASFRRGAIAALTAAALAGCEGLPAFSFAPLGQDRGQLATQEVRLTGGLAIRAPAGKCIDLARTEEMRGFATLVMANCSNLGGRPDAGAPEAALLLVTVSDAAHGDLATLGRAISAAPSVLARSGVPEDVELLSLRQSDLALYANLVDRSDGGPEGLSPRHWKAALDVAGRGVVISVFGPEGGTLPAAGGERLARAAAQAILDANRGTALPATPPLPAEAVETTRQSTDASPGELRRLFGNR
ncbi:MAG: hypothetical protein AAFP13_08615 [Pseudomonadota bacterium]